MKKIFISILLIGLVITAYQFFTATKNSFEDSKIIENYDCGNYNLAIQMNIRRNWLEGDDVGYKITYTDSQFKDNALYYGDLYNFSYSAQPNIMPLNSNIAVHTFFKNTWNLADMYTPTDIYIPKSGDPVLYATNNKQFTDAEFLNLSDCLQKNVTAINNVLLNLKKYIPTAVLKRTSSILILSDDMPQLGNLIHIERYLLDQKIRNAFFEKKSDVVFIQKIFRNEYGTVSIDFRGDIRSIDDYSAWEKRGGGDVGTNSLGTVFTTNIESSSSLSKALQDALKMEAEDGTTFKDHLTQGQIDFGITFTEAYQDPLKFLPPL